MRPGARTPARAGGTPSPSPATPHATQARDAPQTAANARWKMAVRAVSPPRHGRAHSSPARDRRGGQAPGRAPSKEKGLK